MFYIFWFPTCMGHWSVKKCYSGGTWQPWLRVAFWVAIYPMIRPSAWSFTFTKQHSSSAISKHNSPGTVRNSNTSMFFYLQCPSGNQGFDILFINLQSSVQVLHGFNMPPFLEVGDTFSNTAEQLNQTSTTSDPQKQASYCHKKIVENQVYSFDFFLTFIIHKFSQWQQNLQILIL